MKKITIAIALILSTFANGEDPNAIASKILEAKDAALFLDSHQEIKSLDERRLFLEVAKKLAPNHELRSQVLTHFFAHDQPMDDAGQRIESLNLMVDYYIHTLLDPSSGNLSPQRRGVLVDSIIRSKLASKISSLAGVVETQDGDWESSSLKAMERIEVILKAAQEKRKQEPELFSASLKMVKDAQSKLAGS